MSELGTYLKQLRLSRCFSLRDVERITDGKVSNAYLSQVETGKVKHPTAVMLHRLASAYNADFGEMMKAAGEDFRAPETACPTCGQTYHGGSSYAVGTTEGREPQSPTTREGADR